MGTGASRGDPVAGSSCNGKASVVVIDQSKVSVSGGGDNRFDVAVRTASRMPCEPGVIANNVRILFVMGPPGSGKSTQCKQLAGTLGYTHIHLADILRDEIKRNTELGQSVRDLMAAGETVPNEVSMALLKSRISEAYCPIILLDGFPRTTEQAASFQRNVTRFCGVLYFDLPTETAVERVVQAGSSDAAAVRRLHKSYLDQATPLRKHFMERMKCQVVSAVGTPSSVGRATLAAVQHHLNFIPDDAKSVSDFSQDSDDEDTQYVQSPRIPVPSKEDKDLMLAVRMKSEAPWIAGALKDDLRVIFVLGPPGSGKSTQCERLKERYGFAHLYVGDLLREEVNSGSALGRMADECMANGELVPMHISLTLLKRAMLNSTSDVQLIDGFPRSLDQVSIFNKQIAPCSGVLFYDISKTVALRRLLKRGETSGRVDDNAVAIDKQFVTFMSQAVPVREHFLKLGKCQVINGESTPDAVFEFTATALRGFGEELHLK